MSIHSTILHLYDKKHKQLLFIPMSLLMLSLIVLAHSYITTGEFVTKGVSLKGGITLTFTPPSDISTEQLQTTLSASLPGDVNVRGLTEGGRVKYMIIEASDVDEPMLIKALGDAGVSLKQGEYSTENIGSSIGNNFFYQTQLAILFAFVGMALVVFITFRSIVPSLFVVLAAASSLVETLAVISLLEVRLSTAGIAAFLMLIGYSVDTDILLTTRVLKRKEGTLFERVRGATKTGLTMTITALASTLVGLFFTQSDVIRQIMLIISIGLVFDIINTWLQNASILRTYLEKKGHQ